MEYHHENLSFEELVLLVEKLRVENEVLKGVTARTLALETHVSPSGKFDGKRSNARKFVNKVKLVFTLQPLRYPRIGRKWDLLGRY